MSPELSSAFSCLACPPCSHFPLRLNLADHTEAVASHVEG